MLVRNCAGGVVFHKDKVLILKNEKQEWVFPKGVIRSNNLPEDVAVERVTYEAGCRARIVSPAGRTNYEFYSISRMRPVCNKIVWFIMVADDTAQLAIPEGYKVLSAASYNYGAVIETLIDKRQAKVLGGESIPLNFNNGGFYDIEEALEMITYSQDKSLLMLSYEKYRELI